METHFVKLGWHKKYARSRCDLCYLDEVKYFVRGPFLRVVLG